MRLQVRHQRFWENYATPSRIALRFSHGERPIYQLLYLLRHVHGAPVQVQSPSSERTEFAESQAGERAE